MPSGSDTEVKPATTAAATTPTPEVAPEKKTETAAPQTTTQEAQSSDDYDDFDSFFDFDFPRIEFPRSEWKKRSRLIAEKEMVVLPDVEVTMSDDKKALLVLIKGLQTKKEDVVIDLYEDKGYATISFPFNEATITMKLWNDEFALSGVKTIIQEKKDDKGKVLSSSSYKGYNSLARSLPRRVYLNSLKKNHPQYKDGILTLTFDLKESKETISVE